MDQGTLDIDDTEWTARIGASIRQTARAIQHILSDRRVMIALLLVLLTDSAIELLDIFYRYRRIEGPRVSEYFYLSNDGSLGEYFEYLLTGMAACMLLVIAARRRSRLIFVAGLLFAWLMLDNWLMIHENGGALLAWSLHRDRLFGMPVQDMGELAVYACAAILILSALVWAARPPLSGIDMAAFAAIIVAIASAAFGVGFDMIHSLIPMDHPILREITGFIEDGGELWTISFASLLALGTPMVSGVDQA